PDTNRSRDVLDALLQASSRAGVELFGGHRGRGVERRPGGFEVVTSLGNMNAGAVVLATGGRSLPKTGSDGAGYDIARALGLSLIAQTPALAPLVLDPGTPNSVHAALSGTAVDGEIAVWVDGTIAARLSGALLFTH